MYKDYQVLFVDDYSEVTEQLLLDNNQLFIDAQTQDLSKLDLNNFFETWKKTLVVSNHNSDLGKAAQTTYDYGFSPDNTIIYDRSDEVKDWSHLGESIRSPNVGENIYDIMRYIVEHYDNLPDVCIFIKGNMFQRPEERGGAEYYTTHEKFYRALTAEYFLPIERFHEQLLSLSMVVDLCNQHGKH